MAQENICDLSWEVLFVCFDPLLMRTILALQLFGLTTASQGHHGGVGGPAKQVLISGAQTQDCSALGCLRTHQMND